ncbi:MAG: hypothetical protein U0174_20375 [Polyangiaceae bacterium]
MKRVFSRWMPLAGLVLTSLGIGAHAHADGVALGARARMERVQELVSAMDYGPAKAELDAIGSVPDVERDALYMRSQIALGQGDYDEAARLLSAPIAQGDEGGRYLSEIARGTARAASETTLVKDDALGIELRFQDEHDAVLAPLVIDTVKRAREHLTTALAVDWPKPTRVFMVRDHLSLAATTGLPYEAARTTGTVAVAKWGRVTMLTPRASPHGYSWRDTLAHELTHVAITRKSADRAPLWLQEGMAKHEETRWRAPGLFDERPSPDAIVTRGIELKLDLPLDGLGPSLAMLPSPQAALVAYSEVASFLGFLVQHGGDKFAPRFLDALRSEKGNVDKALSVVTGEGMKPWEARWREYLAKRPRETLPREMGLERAPAAAPATPEEKAQAAKRAGSDVSNARQMRERIRLAELLGARGHHAQALKELDAIDALPGVQRDPRYRALRGRTLELLSRLEDAKRALGDPKDLYVSYGPFWAVRGRVGTAEPSFPWGGNAAYEEGISIDPLDVEIACRVLDARATAAGAKDSPTASLCDAALARKEPLLGAE